MPAGMAVLALSIMKEGATVEEMFEIKTATMTQKSTNKALFWLISHPF